VCAVLLRAPAEVVFLDPLPKRPPVRLADIKEHVGAVDRVMPIYLIEPMVLVELPAVVVPGGIAALFRRAIYPENRHRHHQSGHPTRGDTNRDDPPKRAIGHIAPVDSL
jgi:hypothetical protein